MSKLLEGGADMTTIKICEIINKAFSEPFMPDGFVKAHDVSDIYDKPTVSLHIGARNVTFALDGEFRGQGTDFTSEWYSMTEDAQKLSRMRTFPVWIEPCMEKYVYVRAAGLYEGTAVDPGSYVTE